MKNLSVLFSSRWFRLVTGLIISLGTIFLAIRNVDFALVWAALKNARLIFIFLALGSVLINTLVKARRWKVLVGPDGQAISLWKYWMILLTGQMLNALLPARLGDLTRAYTLGGLGPGRTFVLGTIVLEKMFDSLAYLCLFGVLFVLIPLPEWMSGSILVFLLVTLALVAGVIVLVYYPTPLMNLLRRISRLLPERLRSWLSPRIESGLRSLEIIRRRKDLARLTFWTALVWGTAILNNYLVMQALDLHLPLVAPVLILVGLQAGISLITIPGTIGVFEYICVLALTFFGVEPSLAFSYGLLLHAIVLLPPLLGGMISFWALGLSGKQLKFENTLSQPSTQQS